MADRDQTTVGDHDAANEAEAAADPARITRMIQEIAEIGGDHDGGVSRLAFTHEERRAHALVGGWMADLGMDVRTDAIGNTIGQLPGRTPTARAIGTGSHLDSVPRGGRYDGVAGVVAGIEAARVLVENEVALERPFRVVAFAAEEGARFGEPCIGSKAVTGKWNARNLERLVDVDGVSAPAAMQSVGLDPSQVESCRWDADDWAGFLELHIEQAHVLQAISRPIGLVDMVSGSTRVEFTMVGRAQHTGGTPMRLRKDALAAAAEVVLFAEQLANGPNYRGARATVGRLDVSPNSITTIPGEVRFVLDMRDIDSDRQRRGAARIAREATQIADRRGMSCSYRILSDSSPAVLPAWLREITRDVCVELGMDYRVMTSGASHDSQVVNRVVPAAMIFVPSKNGLSHVAEEWTSAVELALGTDVLVRSVARLDAFLSGLAPDVAAVGAVA